MITLLNYTNLIGRLFIAAIFLVAGASKIPGYQATQAYMQSMGVAGELLPLVIVTELAGSMAIIVGYQTRVAAFLLAGFSILSALLFHFDFNDQMQSILLMKNFAISGGLLFLVVHGAGAISIDRRIENRAQLVTNQ